MNAHVDTERQALELVDIIDFKWLMSSVGLRVHVERLQSDRAYAIELLTRAAASQSEAVRSAAARLRVRMGLGSV
ncbi:MAG: hypothetical protein U1F56_18200 [Rubrivivax sp.]